MHGVVGNGGRDGTPPHEEALSPLPNPKAQSSSASDSSKEKSALCGTSERE
jgi:hypothetical protein